MTRGHRPRLHLPLGGGEDFRILAGLLFHGSTSRKKSGVGDIEPAASFIIIGDNGLGMLSELICSGIA